MAALWQDFRFGFRTLSRHPATTAIALLTLALGIGANTAIFSVVDAVLLRPLPYLHPDQLVVVMETNQQRGFTEFPVSPPHFKDWRDQNRVLAPLVAMRHVPLSLAGGDRPEALDGAAVSWDFFRLLGLPMARGRGFRTEEDRPGGAARVVVLSHALWQRRFGGSPETVGRTVTLDGLPYTVVGVADPRVDLPRKAALWVPLAMDFSAVDRGDHQLTVVGRLRPGTTLTGVRTEMSGLAARLARQYAEDQGWGTMVTPLHELSVEGVKASLSLLESAVWVVLLIACANVANLLLARVAGREREIAARSALGAGRARLLRQLLTESIVLFGGGGVIGLVLAVWCTRALIALDPDGIPRASSIGLNWRVLAYAFAVSVATGLLFGLVPGLSAVGGGDRLHRALKEGGRSLAGGGRARLVREVLVVAEVALALVLLLGAGLLLASFRGLQTVDPGFQEAGVLTATLALPAARYPDPARQATFFTRLIEQAKALPGVTFAATGFPLPLDGGTFILAFMVEGQPLAHLNDAPTAAIHVISPDFFKVMRIPLREGRVFDSRDDPQAAPAGRAPAAGAQAQPAATAVPVVIVNEALAARYWPGQNPVGKRITFDVGGAELHWLSVVGVVGSVRHDKLSQAPDPEIYLAQSQNPMAASTLLLRTDRDPRTLSSEVRTAVKAVDPEQPLARVRTLESLVSDSLSRNRVKTVMVGIFAAVALILASVGVYGLVSYAVTQRTHEIGIRMALGAPRPEVLRLVIGQGMRLVLAGLVLGLVGGALAASRYLADQLYGVGARDLRTYLVVPLTLALVALVANYLPARRATRVDPLEALRFD